MTTAADATRMIRKMVAAEAEDGLSVNDALRAVCVKRRLPFWPMSHLRKGNAKTCDGGLGQKVRRAYLDFCAEQLAQLQHELMFQKATGADDLDDLEAEAAALAEKLAQRRAALK